jgi:hypothetical protein
MRQLLRNQLYVIYTVQYYTKQGTQLFAVLKGLLLAEIELCSLWGNFKSSPLVSHAFMRATHTRDESLL